MKIRFLTLLIKINNYLLLKLFKYKTGREFKPTYKDRENIIYVDRYIHNVDTKIYDIVEFRQKIILDRVVAVPYIYFEDQLKHSMLTKLKEAITITAERDYENFRELLVGSIKVLKLKEKNEN